MLNEHLAFPNKPSPDPAPIALYKYLKILKATDKLDSIESVKWKAMLLMAANSGAAAIILDGE